MEASTTASELKSALTGPQPPLVIDVSKRSRRYQSSAQTIAGALRRDPEAVVVGGQLPRAASGSCYCVHGHEVSQNAGKVAATGWSVYDTRPAGARRARMKPIPGPGHRRTRTPSSRGAGSYQQAGAVLAARSRGSRACR